MGPRPVGRGNIPVMMIVTVGLASMGPRPVGRGNRDRDQWLRGNSGFNGATSCRTWKHRRDVNIAVVFSLQWGHVLSDVETD